MRSIVNLPTLGHRLRALIDGHSSLLEVGCGTGQNTILFDCPVRVGVDIHRPYLEHRVPRKHFIPLCLDARCLPEVFLPHTFAVVALLDIIEHFTRAEGEALLAAAETIATHRVVVFTPRGFFPQQEVDFSGLGGERYQVHKSGWSEEDFLSRGYNVLLLEGFHGPENPAFVAAYGADAPRADALLAWKETVLAWVDELAADRQVPLG